jgi:cellulose biosynthesis protein BcsQ
VEERHTFTALSVLDTVITATNADEKIVKAMDDIQDFVSKIYKKSLNKVLLNHILRSNYQMLSSAK